MLFAALMAKDYPTAELAMSLGADPALVDRFGKKKSPRAYLFRLAKLNLCDFSTNRAAARATGRTACQHASANGAGGEFLLPLARGGGEVFGPPPTHPATKLLPILDKFATELDRITTASSAGRASIASALAAELAVLLPSMPGWVARALADPLRDAVGAQGDGLGSRSVRAAAQRLAAACASEGAAEATGDRTVPLSLHSFVADGGAVGDTGEVLPPATVRHQDTIVPI